MGCYHVSNSSSSGSAQLSSPREYPGTIWLAVSIAERLGPLRSFFSSSMLLIANQSIIAVSALPVSFQWQGNLKRVVSGLEWGLKKMRDRATSSPRRESLWLKWRFELVENMP